MFSGTTYPSKAGSFFAAYPHHLRPTVGPVEHVSEQTHGVFWFRAEGGRLPEGTFSNYTGRKFSLCSNDVASVGIFTPFPEVMGSNFVAESQPMGARPACHIDSAEQHVFVESAQIRVVCSRWIPRGTR